MERFEAMQLTVLLLSLGLLIGVARLLGELARRYRQPAILGELLAGVLLGPTVFGWLAPDAQASLFPSQGINALFLDGIGTVAIVLFLLVAGMEVDLSIVWKQGRSALKVGVLGTFIPFALGLAGAALIPRALGRQHDADPLIFSLFVAIAIAISALPVIAKTLMDLDLYRTDLGMVIVSAAIFSDLIGWTMFAIVLGMMDTQEPGMSIETTLALTAVFIVLTLTVGRWLMHRALPVLHAYTHFPGGVLGFAVTLALFGAAFTEYIGIHAIFGSFMIGVALGDSSHMQERTRVMIDEFVSFIFAPLFFASIGLRINFVTHFDTVLVLLILALACVGKLLGAVLGARWAGLPRRSSWAVGFALNSRGAMEIILGMLALEAGIIRQRLFVALVVMAIVTSAISGPLIRWALGQQQSRQILSYLTAKLFLRHLKAASRFDAIGELASAAAQHSGLDAATIERVAWEREKFAATGIGHGVAIPHARLTGVEAPVVVIGLSEAGIDFDSPDGQPVHLIFLLITPVSDPAVQLELSTSISRLFRDPRNLEHVMRSQNFTEFLATLKTSAEREA